MKKEMIKNSMGSKFAKHIIFSLLIIFSFLIAIVIAIVAISFGSDVRQKVAENKREQLRYVGENISQRVSELRRIFYGIGEDSSFYIIGNPDQTGSGHHMINFWRVMILPRILYIINFQMRTSFTVLQER